MLHLKEDTPRNLRVAVLNVLNEIDSDLDQALYETTPETDEALLYLDKVLAGTLEDEKEKEIDAALNETVSLSRIASKIAPIENDD
jgi:hypothetical protein